MSEKPEYSNYVPLSESEQDALSRMVEGQEAFVKIKNWGFHPNPDLSVGDKRLKVKFQMVFDKPSGGISIPVDYFDLSLCLRDGTEVFSSREYVQYEGKSLEISAGRVVNMAWDIMIDKIDDRFMDQFIPRLRGQRLMTVDKSGEVQKHDNGDSDESE